MGNALVPAPSFAPKHKNPPPPKQDNPAKDAICYQCGEVGIFTKEHYSFPSTSWVYDMGCGTHICITTQGLRGSRKLKPGALSLSTWTGPFKTVSRQGASYFVTFTDDFSRYGYVYLLKHKHEVFETFKVFEKEVENQLGKTIKSLLSYHESEYMSQKFLDHLKEHGIIAHRTPPYTPQHNGVSKRRNRTLLDMVRSMMSQTTLPKSFWDYALESVARILNMVPTKKVDKAPYEVWHGQAPKLSYLKV
ncbi:retrotransposon protein, putative, ty1-copia subclass [Tanacetum coccineum]